MTKFGLVLTPSHGSDVDPEVQLREHREMVQLTKDLGFDVIITGQHFATPSLRFFQPIPYLSRLSHLADPMRLATGVLLLPLLHPLAVAEEIATLDALTGGRAVLGVGLGYNRAEAQNFGIPWKRRIRIFEESVQIIRRLLAGERVDWDGHWKLEDVASSTLPVKPGGIPIWVGAQAEPSVRRAARIADTWYAPPFPTHRELIELYEMFLDERAKHDLDPPTELPIRREVVIAENEAAAAQIAERVASERYGIYSNWGLDLGTGLNDRFWDSRFVLGDASLVTDRLHAIIDKVPMSHLVLRMTWPGQPHTYGMQQLTALGESVLPELRKYSPASTSTAQAHTAPAQTSGVAG